MRDPPRQEQHWRRSGEIRGREGHGAAMNKVADMVQGHHNHNGPANRIDSRQPRFRPELRFHRTPTLYLPPDHISTNETGPFPPLESSPGPAETGCSAVYSNTLLRSSIMSSVVLISGTSTGIGRLTAETVARAGHCVYATMRGLTTHNVAAAQTLESLAAEEKLQLKTLDMDVCNTDSVQRAVDTVLQEQGRL